MENQGNTPSYQSTVQPNTYIGLIGKLIDIFVTKRIFIKIVVLGCFIGVIYGLALYAKELDQFLFIIEKHEDSLLILFALLFVVIIVSWLNNITNSINIHFTGFIADHKYQNELVEETNRKLSALQSKQEESERELKELSNNFIELLSSISISEGEKARIALKTGLTSEMEANISEIKHKQYPELLNVVKGLVNTVKSLKGDK